jgi:thiol-disulfide isomerase/thioredoxin
MTSVTDPPEAAEYNRKLTSRRKLVSIGIGTVIAIALIGIASALTGGNAKNTNLSTSAALVGHHLSGFSLGGLFGGTVKAPWEAGRPSVEIFFASYCGPCRIEMPKIAKYLRTHNPSPVAILAIDVTDLRSPAQAMVKQDDFTFPVAFDPQAVVTAGVFGFNYVPESAFVNSKGVVTEVYYGAIPKQQLASGIKNLKSASAK